MLRAGYGIYYNPNQMNSFTFLTNNPPLATVSTYTSIPRIPRCRSSIPPALSPRRRRRHDLADAPSAQRAQGSVERRRAAGTVGEQRRRYRYLGSNTSHLDRSFFNNTPHPGPRRGRSTTADASCSGAAASSRTTSSPTTTRSPSFCVSGCAKACRPTPTTPGRGPATCPRIPTAAARRWTTTISGATMVRRTGTSRTGWSRAICMTSRS